MSLQGTSPDRITAPAARTIHDLRNDAYQSRGWMWHGDSSRLTSLKLSSMVYRTLKGWKNQEPCRIGRQGEGQDFSFH